MQNETIAIHAGYNKKEGNGSMAVPITQTTAYAFRDSEHAANLFALKELGPIYTRLTNPTTDILEQRFAALEGGAAAICTSSGQAASFFAIANVAEAGDNIIISDKVLAQINIIKGIIRNKEDRKYFLKEINSMYEEKKVMELKEEDTLKIADSVTGKLNLGDKKKVLMDSIKYANVKE